MPGIEDIFSALGLPFRYANRAATRFARDPLEIIAALLRGEEDQNITLPQGMDYAALPMQSYRGDTSAMMLPESQPSSTDFQQMSRMSYPGGGRAEYLTGGDVVERMPGGGTFNMPALTAERRRQGWGQSSQELRDAGDEALLGAALQEAVNARDTAGISRIGQAIASLKYGRQPATSDDSEAFIHYMNGLKIQSDIERQRQIDTLHQAGKLTPEETTKRNQTYAEKLLGDPVTLSNLMQKAAENNTTLGQEIEAALATEKPTSPSLKQEGTSVNQPLEKITGTQPKGGWEKTMKDASGELYGLRAGRWYRLSDGKDVTDLVEL